MFALAKTQYFIVVNRVAYRGGGCPGNGERGARIKRVYTYTHTHTYTLTAASSSSPFRFDLEIHLVPAERRPRAPVITGGAGDVAIMSLEKWKINNNVLIYIYTTAMGGRGVRFAVNL